jgi:hypothetical protein
LVHQADGSLGELLGEPLYIGRLDSVEDDDIVNRVKGGGDIICVDHPRDNRKNDGSGQGKSGSKVRKGKGSVERSVGENVCSQAFFLDFSVHQQLAEKRAK